MEETASGLSECKEDIRNYALDILEYLNEKLKILTLHLPLYVRNLIEGKQSSLEMLQMRIRNSAGQMIMNKESRLKEIESFFRLSSPDYILAKGYSITLKNGKAVKSAKDLSQGDIVETVLAEGKFSSVVAISKERK